MQQFNVFLVTLILTCFALLPTAANADSLDDLEVTMEVVDNIGDISDVVAEMDGPEDRHAEDDERESGDHEEGDSDHEEGGGDDFESDDDFDEENDDFAQEHDFEEGEYVDDDRPEEDDMPNEGDDVFDGGDDVFEDSAFEDGTDGPGSESNAEGGGDMVD